MFKKDKYGVRRIRIPTANTKAFETTLEYIYTTKCTLSTLTLNSVLTVFEFAVYFKLQDLEDLAVRQLKHHINDVTMPSIIKTAELYSSADLANLCVDYVEEHSEAVLKHKNFKLLSIDAVKLLIRRFLRVPQLLILETVTDWMHANLEDEEQFSNLLEFIKWDTITEKELSILFEPDWLISKDTIDGIKLFQQENVATISKFPDKNVAIPEKCVPTNYGYSIDLERNYYLNCLKMRILGDEDHSYTVSFSSDYSSWKCVIDQSKSLNRGFQEHYFTERTVRFIRIHSTTPAKFELDIPKIEVLYSATPIEVDPETVSA